MSRIASLIRLAILFLGLGVSIPASAQLQFFTSVPNIDSFPVVKVPISVSYNGKPAPIEKKHLSILEDGNAVTDFELIGCDEADAASIALFVDISGSMQFTVLYNGPSYFYDGFSAFVRNIYAPSEIALIPFNDTVSRVLPISYRAQDFFKAEDYNDTTELIDSVGGFLFAGNTDVDYALWIATQHLTKGAHRRKAIVLVTDDAIYAENAVTKMLKDEGIALFVLEMDNDTIIKNISVANATGGKLFSPGDSTEIPMMMEQIAQAIYAKTCTVRYVSKHPCPWYSEKILWLGLNYQSYSRSETHRFKLGPNNKDTIAPVLTETVLSQSSRIIKATENFPCTRGIASFTDSALVNFAKMTRFRQWSNLVYDSIVVVNESMPAHGWYIAIDSSSNASRIEIEYTPPPDTLDPVWTIPLVKGQQYNASVTEVRKWDRGLKDVTLDPASINLKLDSISFISHKIAQAYVSILDVSKAASGCLVAFDSVGNEGRVCMDWSAVAGDERPPVITQTTETSPYLTLSATVDELQPKDRGLLSISFTPISNAGVETVSYLSAFEATVSIPLLDSMFDASGRIVAVDSAGNRSEQVILYSTRQDRFPPVANVIIVDASTREVLFADKAAWDRGILSVTVLSAVNTNADPVIFLDKHNASIRLQLVDPYTEATISVEAIDSVGNPTSVVVAIPADVKPELKPLIVNDPLDFGSTPAPAFMRQSVRVTNPNIEAVTLLSGTWTGDDSVFAYDMDFPLSIEAGQSADLYYIFRPQLLGDWVGLYEIVSDKLTPFSIRTLGQSTGIIHISASSEAVTSAGAKGTLRLQIEGIPSIMNLDQLSFTITVDPNVATLESPKTECASYPWLCNYRLDWSELQPGQYRCNMERLSPALSLIVTPETHLDIPFATHLGISPASVVELLEGSASLAEVVLNSGSIAMGDECADETIRAAMNGELALQLSQVHVADGYLSLSFESYQDGPATLSVTDMSGKKYVQATIEVRTGQNLQTLNVDGLPSGAYLLVMKSAGSVVSRKIEIVR